MKLKTGFITHDSGGEHMAIATGPAAQAFNGMIRNNETADFIFRQLLTETTEERIVEAMGKQYAAPRERIAADVHNMVARLRAEGFLEE